MPRRYRSILPYVSLVDTGGEGRSWFVVELTSDYVPLPRRRDRVALNGGIVRGATKSGEANNYDTTGRFRNTGRIGFVFEPRRTGEIRKARFVGSTVRSRDRSGDLRGSGVHSGQSRPSLRSGDIKEGSVGIVRPMFVGGEARSSDRSGDIEDAFVLGGSVRAVANGGVVRGFNISGNVEEDDHRGGDLS